MPTRVTHTINYYFNTYLASTNSSSSSRVPSPKEKSTLLSALGTQLSRFRHPHLHTVLCIQLLSAAARQFLDLGKPRFGRKESIFQGQARGRQENTPLKLVSQSTSEAPWTKTNAPEPTLLLLYILLLLLLSAKNYLPIYLVFKKQPFVGLATKCYNCDKTLGKSKTIASKVKYLSKLKNDINYSCSYTLAKKRKYIQNASNI